MANVTQINQNQDPTQIASIIIEKKIRNLEKRKTRLLEIKALEDKGQHLEADRTIAVKKLDGVIELIDTLKDINKNVYNSLNMYFQNQKKQVKKEQLEKQQERHQQELDKVKMLLNMQALLTHLPNLQTYLTKGDGKSINIDDKQIQAFEKIAELLSSNNIDNLSLCAEKVILILSGSKKEFSTGVTYFDLKETFTSLINEKCFEKLTPSALDNVASLSKQTTTQAEEFLLTDQLKPETHDSTFVTNAEHQELHLGNMRDTIGESSRNQVAVASGMAYPPPLVNYNPTHVITSNVPYYNPYLPVSIPTQRFFNHHHYSYFYYNHYPFH